MIGVGDSSSSVIIGLCQDLSQIENRKWGVIITGSEKLQQQAIGSTL